MIVADSLLERFTGEYLQKSTNEWGMTLQEYIDFKMECEREVNETLLEVNNGEEK